MDNNEKSVKTNYNDIIRNIVKVIAIAMVFFQIYTAATTPFTAVVQRGVHIGFALAMVFFVFPFKTRSGRTFPLVDIVLCLMGASSAYYIVVNYHEIANRAGVITNTDILFGIFMIICVIEGTRRTLGLAMPIIATAFLLYNYYGNLIPGEFGHAGFGIGRIINILYASTEGIFSIPLGVSATYVGMFVAFGVFLQKTGGGDFFFRFANALLGHVTGGPAKVAVVASGFMGMMTGSVVANVVTSGTFTIPMMKKVGFEKNFAGAVEAAASTGGLIMPPVMGAAAFIIAEVLGIPYWELVVPAFIPAILYYIALFTAVDLRARVMKIKTLKKDETESVLGVIRDGWYFLLPIIVLVYLISMGITSVLKAGFYAIVTTLLVAFIFRRDTVKPAKLAEMFEEGGKGLIMVATACACAGIILGVFSLTGLGLKLASLLVALSGGYLIVLLLLTMICCLILGMGVSPTAAYIVLAILVAPALTQMGVAPMAAHMFIFYFAIYANITPPVAVGAYAAAAISGGKADSTAIKAFRIALPGIIVPFSFAYHSAILLIGTPSQIIFGISTALVGVLVMTVALEGYLFGNIPWPLRVVLVAAGCVLIMPGLVYNLIAFAVIVAALILHLAIRSINKKTGKEVLGQ
jgi:TRAP transporter 4TM/12TM fusion protein